MGSELLEQAEEEQGAQSAGGNGERTRNSRAGENSMVQRPSPVTSRGAVPFSLLGSKGLQGSLALDFGNVINSIWF